MKNGTYKYLDISTAHITTRDLERLATIAQQERKPCTVAQYDYGVFIGLPEDTHDLAERLDVSTAFANIFRHCRKNEIMVIRLDVDGETLDNFPTFEH